MTKHHQKPVRRSVGGCAAVSLSALQKKARLENLSSELKFDLSSHLCVQRWHTFQGADYGIVCRYLSALCLPVIPLSVHLCLQQVLGALQEYPWDIWKMLCWQMNMRMTPFCNYSPAFSFTEVWNKKTRGACHPSLVHIWRECSECRKWRKFQESGTVWTLLSKISSWMMKHTHPVLHNQHTHWMLW